jgi:general secretion pathway protein A
LQSSPYFRFFSFFGLRENPFAVSRDPRYLFITPGMQEAWEALEYGIRSREGIILLTGEAGTGKTLLIRRLIEWLHERRTPTAYIFNSNLEPKHLYDFMLADFGVQLDPRWQGNALMHLGQWLPECCRAGQVPVLIVDEAQGLPLHVLEEIRLLLNLESPQEKLLQIVLVGQPELEGKLNRPETRQLKQRIALRCKTAPLTLKETRDYIRARLEIAGAAGRPIFSLEAVEAVHAYSRGVPRVMNLLCEHALINAYVGNMRLVAAKVLDEVAREFHFDEEKYVPRVRTRIADTLPPPLQPSPPPQQNPVVSESPFPAVQASTPRPVVHATPLPVAGRAESVAAPSFPPPAEPVPPIMRHHQPGSVQPQHGAVPRPSGDLIATMHPLMARQSTKQGATRSKAREASLDHRALATLRNSWPKTLVAPALKSKLIKRGQEGLHETWSNVSDKRRLSKFKAAVASSRESGTRRLSFAFPRAKLSLQDLWKAAASVWQRTREYLSDWLRHSLPLQYSSTEPTTLADRATSAKLTSSPNVSQLKQNSRKQIQSGTLPSDEPRMNVVVLWLRQPFGSSHPLHPNRRATAPQNR